MKDKLNTRARCNVCHKMIDLSSSGRSAFSDHAKGKKHKNSFDKVQNFFKPRGTTEAREINPSNSEANTKEQSTLETHLERSGATKAEIVWSLKSVMSGFSARSNEDMNETLAEMFPEFETAKSFQMSRSKSMYVVNHGLAPYFKSLLKSNLHKADFLVYSFDESLNDVTQTTEMDLYVK